MNSSEASASMRYAMGMGPSVVNPGSLSASQQCQQPRREPWHVGDDEDAGAENRHHRQRGGADLEHRPLEPVRGKEDVEPDERRQEAELEVRDEDDPEVHRV